MGAKSSKDSKTDHTNHNFFTEFGETWRAGVETPKTIADDLTESVRYLALGAVAIAVVVVLKR